MKKKQMILLAVLLAVLAAGYGILVFQNKKAEKAEQAAEESKIIKVAELGEIESFSYQAPDQDELHFKKKKDKWICTEDKKASLEQTYPNRIADTFSSLTASRKLEDIDALEDYGLEKPAYTVTLNEADGTKTTIKVGNSTGGEYYLQVEGEEQVVYTAASSSVEALNYSLEDMLEEESGEEESDS